MSRRYHDADFLREQYVEHRRSVTEIADMCDVSHSTISRWLDRHDIDRKPRYRNHTWLYEQYVENRRNQSKIADECGVSKTTICHWLARLGITDGESLDTDECLTCGETFRYYPSVRDGQFCSNECAKDPDKRQVTITCPNCEETFERRQSLDTRYCSMACWGEDNRVTADTDELYRGVWHRQRQLALQRDGYQCVVCGIDDNRHREQFGHGLDVHHFVPVRRFVKCNRPPSEAHALKNLVSVCRTHHPDAGGQTIDPGSKSPKMELKKHRHRYR